MYQKSSDLKQILGKVVLPEGTLRVDDADAEEFTIPVTAPAAVRSNEKKVSIDQFESWIRPTFKGYASLNRVQSIVYPIAFETNENLLVCAPTGKNIQPSLNRHSFFRSGKNGCCHVDCPSNHISIPSRQQDTFG